MSKNCRFKDNEKDNRDRRFRVTRNRVYATGNKWAIENFNALNERY